jgi:cardiolipin synthase A/B
MLSTACFLKHGIEIYEYRKSYMHSKVAVIDGEWATVGSSNIDPFSLLLAREANVVVSDKTFAEELRTDILKTIQDGASKLSHEDWRHRHLAARFASWLAYGFLRIFLGLIGYLEEQ